MNPALVKAILKIVWHFSVAIKNKQLKQFYILATISAYNIYCIFLQYITILSGNVCESIDEDKIV